MEQHVHLSELLLDLIIERLAGRAARWQRPVRLRHVKVQRRVFGWKRDLVDQNHTAAAKLP
jgi:hypothetical protein